MKKIVSLALTAVLALSLVACGTGKPAETTLPTDTTPVETTTPIETTNPENENETPAASGAVGVLENIWNLYAEDEKFAVIGGNIEAPVDGAPGNYDMAYAEGLTWNLLIPEAELANIDEAASMIHMMNANTFTAGVVHLVEGTDVEAFANTMRDAIQNNQWMCGFPETLTIASIEGGYVLIAFGVNDAMNPFMTHFTEAYADAKVLFNEAIAG